MKILFVSNLYPPNTIGGYERLCHNVVTAFAARGHEVVVLTSGSDGGQSYPRQTIHRSLRLLANAADIYAPFAGDEEERQAINVHNITELRRVLTLERPDVVFAWNLYFLDSSFLTELDQVTTPVVFMLTDNWLIAALDADFIGRFFLDHAFGEKPFPVDAGGWRSLFTRLRRPTVRFFFRHGAIFGSDFMHRLHQAAGIGFAASRVIHNGARLAKMPDSAFADRTRLCDPSQTKLLIAGRLVDLKGVHTAIEALPHLRNQRPPIKLTILGDAQDAAYKQRLDSPDSEHRRCGPHRVRCTGCRGADLRSLPAARHLALSLALRALLPHAHPSARRRHPDSGLRRRRERGDRPRPPDRPVVR